MKKRFFPLLLLLLAGGAFPLLAQKDPGDTYFRDWGKRFNRAWMKSDTLALQELLADDMLITLSGPNAIEEQTKPTFIAQVKLGNASGQNRLGWGKAPPHFYSANTLAVRRPKEGRTVWLLQNHCYKQQWSESNRLMQDSGIISMQTSFQAKNGKWRPVASFINFRPLKATNPWGCLSRALDISTFEGKPFRVKSAVKTAVQEGGYAVLWARIDKKNGEMGFFDNMYDRAITEKEWAVYQIKGVVDAGADSLFFGGCLSVPGAAWFDEFLLEVEESPGKWVPIALENCNFETTEPEGATVPGWGGNAFHCTNFDAGFSPDAPFRGKLSFGISGKPEQ